MRPQTIRLPDPLPCPDWLGPIAREKFNEIAERNRTRLTEGMADLLSLYANAYEDFLQAVETLRAEGTVLTARNGIKYTHPAAQAKNTAAGQMKNLAARLGLTRATDSKPLSVASRNRGERG